MIDIYDRRRLYDSVCNWSKRIIIFKDGSTPTEGFGLFLKDAEVLVGPSRLSFKKFDRRMFKDSWMLKDSLLLLENRKNIIFASLGVYISNGNCVKSNRVRVFDFTLPIKLQDS